MGARYPDSAPTSAPDICAKLEAAPLLMLDRVPKEQSIILINFRVLLFHFFVLSYCLNVRAFSAEFESAALATIRIDCNVVLAVTATARNLRAYRFGSVFVSHVFYYTRTTERVKYSFVEDTIHLYSLRKAGKPENNTCNPF